MFTLQEPWEEELERFLRSQQDSHFSYPEVGASKRGAPPGYTADHNRVRLGEGEEVFERAVESLRGWRMFDIGWLRIFPARASIEPGTTIGLLARHLGFWSLGACRIVYLVQESADVRRYGFAYGTLPEHAERGEERFTVELRRDGSVWYDLYAFSRPNHPLVRAGYPLGRLVQRRFARDSLRAMVHSVAQNTCAGC